MRLVEGRREDQQRYNVAASRARDQMWIVHSFQPSNDLQPNDLRARLLKQAERPGQEAQVELLKRQTESPFEEQVLERLIRAGYQVEPQFAVGAYRVDMVIKGYSRRVAIECDGEAYHGLDRVKADLDRQRILERVARLTFIRIRGSLYFRDPEEAMRLVFQRLEELGIEKVGTNVRELAPASSELKERVVRRCQQIRGESNGGSATIDDCWRLLKTLLRDWPQLRAQIHDSNFEVRALSVSHDHEEVILVDAKSPALVAFAQLAKLRYLKTLEVDPEQPHEALNQLLRAFKLDQQVDSQETFAAVESHPKPAVSPITTPPEETLTAPQAIVAVLMQVVKADGVVLAEELNGVEEFFSKRFNFGSQTAEEVRHWIDLYSSQEAPRGPVSRALRSLSQSHRELVLQGAIELAWCDHQFHASEQSVIRSLGIELDLDLATVEGLLAQNRREEFDPYKVLGLTSLAQPREIFEAVQRLRMKFHRSLFDTQEVEFQNLAATRRAEIEKAWNALRPAEEISKPELGSFDLSIFPAYRAFEGYAGPDPRDAPLSAVMDGLVEILQVESPVSTSRLFEVYLRGCGIKRLGHELRKYLTRALGWAVERQLARVVEGQDHSSPLAVVALPSGPSVFIRERGPRTFDQIPDGELKDLGRRLSSQHQDGSEEHLRAILDHYEFKRLTSGTRDRLMDALAGRARREVESDGQERELGGLPD